MKPFLSYLPLPLRPRTPFPLPVLLNSSISVGLNPIQVPGHSKVDTGPVQFTTESKTKGSDSNLSSATVRLNDTQRTAIVSLASASKSTKSTHMIVGYQVGESGATGQVGDDRKAHKLQMIGEIYGQIKRINLTNLKDILRRTHPETCH